MEANEWKEFVYWKNLFNSSALFSSLKLKKNSFILNRNSTEFLNHILSLGHSLSFPKIEGIFALQLGWKLPWYVLFTLLNIICYYSSNIFSASVPD